MRNKILLLIVSFFLLLPSILFAQSNQDHNEEIFKAHVIEIIDQKNTVREDGSTSIQQKIKLQGFEGKWKDEEVVFDGTKFDILSANEYQIGDTVLVNYNINLNGEKNFYIIGFSRTSSLYWLVFLFILIVIAIGKFKGLRALSALLLTFLIILKFIIPKILAGNDPLFISIIGSFFILILSICITEGFKRTSAIAIFSILISLIITGLLSIWFSTITKLTGFASEEATY